MWLCPDFDLSLAPESTHHYYPVWKYPVTSANSYHFINNSPDIQFVKMVDHSKHVNSSLNL
jgi:hypothetical protein